jgi:hypothetical protein
VAAAKVWDDLGGELREAKKRVAACVAVELKRLPLEVAAAVQLKARLLPAALR